MAFDFRRTDPSTELVDIIRQVRRRWRMKLALRGALGVIGLGLLVLLLSAWGLEAWRFTPGSIITFRIVLGLSVVGLVAYLLIKPLMQHATDEQVALYLEEHEPSLQAEIISAIDASQQHTQGSSNSAALVQRLVESAIQRVRAIEYGRRVERAPVRRYAATLGVVAMAALVLFGFGPAYLRHALSALLIVSRDVEAAAPYRIEVTPGNASVPRGADQTVTAHLSGFDADQASLMVRKTPDAAFERLPLVRGEGGRYEGMLFDLAAPLDYFVEAAGVRSPVFTLKVVDLPYVSRLELEYHFPAYTGLPPQKIEDGGDIAVLKGTEVRVRAIPTMEAPAGQVVLNDKPGGALTPAGSADHAMTGAFKVEEDGFYRIELNAPGGDRVPASPQYTIDALADQPPTVSIAKPGRDTTASPIEEVFVEARAQDDFGVHDLDLVYSVNGGPEKTVRLFNGNKRLSEVSAGHTLYLEELNVQAGDFVSYYAKAIDNDTVEGPKPAMSDMYFVRVRPLNKDFRRAQSDAPQGGGGGGGQQNQVGALSEQQRQIISATFNLQRDRKKLAAAKVRENAVVIALAQSRLREQVDGLVTRMNSRLVEQDPAFKKVAELLPLAVAQMKAAEGKLQAVSPEGALPPEQKALQFLQKAEEEYEVQVQMQRQQGGGGGGGAGSMAEDLADLFEMELDKMANQYETRQQASQQQQDQKVDELLEKLKELARRQEQEAERQRRRAAAGQQSSSGGGGQQQRALAEQAEEAARRLEQLSREEQRAGSRGDRTAASQCGRCHAEGGRQRRAGVRRTGASCARAVEAGAGSAPAVAGRPRRSRREERPAAGRAARARPAGHRQRRPRPRRRRRPARAEGAAAGRAQERARAEGRRPRKTARSHGRRYSHDRKGRRAQGVRGRERDPRQSRARQDPVLRVDGALGRVRRGHQDMERRIGADLDALKDKLGEAASALGRSRPDQMSEALDKARQLARGLESMDQRTRERAQGSGERAQGQGAGSGLSKAATGSARPTGPARRSRASKASRGNRVSKASRAAGPRPGATGPAGWTGRAQRWRSHAERARRRRGHARHHAAGRERRVRRSPARAAVARRRAAVPRRGAPVHERRPAAAADAPGPEGRLEGARRDPERAARAGGRPRLPGRRRAPAPAAVGGREPQAVRVQSPPPGRAEGQRGVPLRRRRRAGGVPQAGRAILQVAVEGAGRQECSPDIKK